MLRVLIADDEPRICKLIEVLADWDLMGMEVVGVAHNGVEALSMVHALGPDILITDIRMPGQDGLAVIREAKAMLPGLEVIIISGYAQFDYARTAIQHGVGEYLLKPINQQDLNATLRRMGETCRARRTQAETAQRLKESERGERDRRREALVADLLAGAALPEARDAFLARYPLSQSDCYQAFLLKLDFDLERFSPQSLDIVHGKAADVLRPLLLAHCDDLLLSPQDAALYGILCYGADRQSALRNQLRDGLNQLVARQNLFGEVLFSMAIGAAVQDPSALRASLKDAQAGIAERLIEGTGRLLEGSAAPPALDGAELLSRYLREVTQAIDVLEEREAERAADALRQAANVPHVRGEELLSLVRGAGTVFVTQLGCEGREQVLQRFFAQCQQSSDQDQLFACLKGLQRAQLQEAIARRQNQDGQPIRLAKQYIQRHYARPITLEEVSSAIGFSVNYFSTLFKRETGEGFARYLMHVRMDAAKGLLRETRLPVQKVCREVGYEDSKHFTRIFRAETGLTPGEFRKLYG